MLVSNNRVRIIFCHRFLIEYCHFELNLPYVINIFKFTKTGYWQILFSKCRDNDMLLSSMHRQFAHTMLKIDSMSSLSSSVPNMDTDRCLLERSETVISYYLQCFWHLIAQYRVSARCRHSLPMKYKFNMKNVHYNCRDS